MTTFPVLLALLMLAVNSCAAWVPIKGKQTMTAQSFTVDLPDGWKRDPRSQDTLRVTMDGSSLDEITISKHSVGKPLQFTQKSVRKGMLPQEAADVIVDDLRSNPNLLSLRVIQNSPETIAGNPGFKIVCTYRTRRDLPTTIVEYGIVLDQWYYLISYEAPSRYYFPKHLPAFERVRNSFRLLQ